MIKSRTIAISLAALTVTACAHNQYQDTALTRLETDPLIFYGTPGGGSTLTEQTVTQEAELASSVHTVDEERLETLDQEPDDATSARSTISLL